MDRSVIGLVGFFMANVTVRQKVVGTSFGILLWATIAWVTWLGLSAAPRAVSNLPST
jgi:hypothetical protein